VVRTYGGDPHLQAALQRRGVQVLTLSDASDFPQIRRNIRLAAAAMGRGSEGEALVAEMDGRLARAAGAWQGRRALYLTPGGFTAGPGTLPDAILRAAGLVNAAQRPGYGAISLERFVLDPPDAVVLGFFDTQMAADTWAPARHGAMQRILRQRTIASLPGALIDCADWAAAEAVEVLAAGAPR
jgi:iron complex transport system substrate-binding protein